MERNEKFRPFLRVLDKESKEKNSWEGGGKRGQGGEEVLKNFVAQKKKSETKNESFEAETQVARCRVKGIEFYLFSKTKKKEREEGRFNFISVNGFSLDTCCLMR